VAVIPDPLGGGTEERYVVINVLEHVAEDDQVDRPADGDAPGGRPDELPTYPPARDLETRDIHVDPTADHSRPLEAGQEKPRPAADV
jgi:hypothetical protein